MKPRIAPPPRGIDMDRTVRTKTLEPIHRLRTVKVRTKREPVRVDIGSQRQDDRFARVEDLYKFWERQFFAAFGLAYVPKSRPADLASLDDIFDEVNDPAKIERMIVLLLTHKELAWVAQKNIAWLAKQRNRTFIAPHMLAKRTRTAEFVGTRTQTTKITFRGN